MLGALESGTTSDYDTAVELLNAHFAAPQSALLRRFLFRQRHQLPGEPVQQYVANLRGFASTCKFGALQEEIIRDQLIEHTNDAKVPPPAHTTGVKPQATPPAWQDTPAFQLTPQIAHSQAPDMPINLPAEICACPSQTAQPHPLVSPRLVRIRSCPGHLQDFVSTVHV